MLFYKTTYNNKDMKTRIFYHIVLLTLLFFSSCTERMDIELDSTQKRCVIFGQLTTDTTAHKVTITSSGDYFSDLPPQGISGAEVTISDGENDFILTENLQEPGTYYTDDSVYGEPGKTYTLYVDNVDLLNDGNTTSYEASSDLLPVANADSIKVMYRPDWQGWAVLAYAQDPPETRDFYKFLIYRNGELYTDSLRNINYTDDTFFDGNYTNGVVLYFFNDNDALSPGDTVTAAFCGITQDYYKYLIEARVTTNTSLPLFSGPPANPRSNFTNDAIGYFTAYSVSKASTIIEQD